jgi:hypothetical protein
MEITVIELRKSAEQNVMQKRLGRSFSPWKFNSISSRVENSNSQRVKLDLQQSVADNQEEKLEMTLIIRTDREVCNHGGSAFFALVPSANQRTA